LDNFYLITIGITILAYIIGSIPTAVWVGKIFYGIDIRKYGSGNAGATNTIRVLGPKAGAPVFIIDVLKGVAAVQLAFIIKDVYFASLETYGAFKVILSVVAIIGHVFPVFARFKGGKGVATSLGVVFALAWQPALVSLGIFILVLAIWRYVSLASISAAISFPFISYFVFGVNEWAYIFFSIVIAIFVPLLHKKNIHRLLNREESKFSFKKKAQFKKETNSL
jgi:acyl phosphate:glycerol-3-phosphate acyltransferase